MASHAPKHSVDTQPGPPPLPPPTGGAAEDWAWLAPAARWTGNRDECPAATMPPGPPPACLPDEARRGERRQPQAPSPGQWPSPGPFPPLGQGGCCPLALPPLPLLFDGDARVLDDVFPPVLARCSVDFDPVEWHRVRLPPRSKALSATSLDSPSSAGSTLSPVQTDRSDVLAASLLGRSSHCPSPTAVDDGAAPGLERPTDSSSAPARGRPPAQHYPGPAASAHPRHWSGCRHPALASRDALAWHVQAEHLLVCPAPGCAEVSFSSPCMLHSHIAEAHPDVGKDRNGDWRLLAPTPKAAATPTAGRSQTTSAQSGHGGGSRDEAPRTATVARSSVEAKTTSGSMAAAKTKYQEQLRRAVEKRAARGVGNSVGDIVPARASNLVDAASFALVFEHAVLPFLAELLPAWSGPRHVVSVTRGRAAQTRRICIMTRAVMSRARKVMVASHVGDLLPASYRPRISFVFSVGEVSRAACWARGLDRQHPEDVCSPRNPHHFRRLCMGDSIGTRASGSVAESTATLGPCLSVAGGSYWLVNFHPFVEARQSRETVGVEHPSPQDRARCRGQDHQALPDEGSFQVGHVEATSGWNLSTTRISHDPYWDDSAVDHPLVVTDWALVTTRASDRGANMLRRLPAETSPHLRQPLVRSVAGAGVEPGAGTVSSGRTSGYLRGQVCKVPAYVSGEENGTGKATREWFVEEPPPPWDDEEAWIRGGVGVEGDSGAAIVDAQTHCLVGQLWGRNKYWGPGPRVAFFTPVAVFDDIQEKCSLQNRPQLPQHRDDAERYPQHPTCQPCYQLSRYLGSRRSSRESLLSMIMGADDVNHDWTSDGAASELATPGDLHRGTGVEEIGSSFHRVLSPVDVDARLGPTTPVLPSIYSASKSPHYPGSLDLEDDLNPRPSLAGPSTKRLLPSFDELSCAISAEQPCKRSKTN